MTVEQLMCVSKSAISQNIVKHINTFVFKYSAIKDNTDVDKAIINVLIRVVSKTVLIFVLYRLDMVEIKIIIVEINILASRLVLTRIVPDLASMIW